MEILKKVGWLPITKDEKGIPRQIWLATIKRGQYGVFIAIERHWVTELTAGDKIKETKFAGTAINFPADAVECAEMLKSVTTLVTKARAAAAEFTKTQEEIEDDDYDTFDID